MYKKSKGDKNLLKRYKKSKVERAQKVETKQESKRSVEKAERFKKRLKGRNKLLK